MMKTGILIFIALTAYMGVKAQEMVGPMLYNPHVVSSRPEMKLKITTLALPFFEDFTDRSPFPDPNRWTDYSVYINNTIAVSPVSRGVATFDALNARGVPYDSLDIFSLVYGDSLTSQPFDLSARFPADSIYLSFFYQPQGRGFAPETQDSLMLYFKTVSGDWRKVWGKEGRLLDSFRQVMIPVADPDYLYGNFQFRFVNKVSKYLSDDVWNVDYIRMDAGRNVYDTLLTDLTTTDPPSNMLNDYTSMPYRQFRADMNRELTTTHGFTARNLSGSSRSVVYGYTAREQASNTALSANNNNANIPGYTRRWFEFPVYSVNYNAPSARSRVVLENKYFVSDPAAAQESKVNDTIISEQIFDNYLAYDDGTAEQSYWLQPFSTLPAKTAVEFHLNEPDTLRGIAILFGRQVPDATHKFFSIAVYKNITMGSWTDTPVYQQDFYVPGLVDTLDRFWVYSFQDPVPMNAGTFFIGTIQPAQSGSDSLYFALDLNRRGGNHRYVNVNGYWSSSSTPGAMMIRPLLGQPVVTTAVKKNSTRRKEPVWYVYPNPAQNTITIRVPDAHSAYYEIIDVQGRILLNAEISSAVSVDISALSSGIYFVRILADGQYSLPAKLMKL